MKGKSCAFSLLMGQKAERAGQREEEGMQQVLNSARQTQGSPARSGCREGPGARSQPIPGVLPWAGSANHIVQTFKDSWECFIFSPLPV